jgi:NADPH-dependent curcumin reductase CurA
MPAVKNKQILLASRPAGEPSPANFKVAESEPGEPGEGEILLKTLWLSLDPYMRGRMSAAKSYAKPVEPGEVMVGGTVSEVAASKHKDYKPGDVVLSYDGWQQYALSKGMGLRKLDPKQAPVQTALGVLGMPGMTAYTGLLTIGQPKP